MAHKKLNVSLKGNILPFTRNPVYLRVTLDRSLTNKEHLVKAAKKVTSCVEAIRRLAGTTLSCILPPNTRADTIDLALRSQRDEQHILHEHTTSALTRGLRQEDCSHERQVNYSNNVRLAVAVPGLMSIS